MVSAQQKSTLHYLNATVIPERNEAYQKMLAWFFCHPTEEIGLSELAVALAISKTTANRTVKLLEKEAFIIKKVFGNVWRISCNQQHSYNSTLKVAYNLALVSASGVVEEVMTRYPGAGAVVLFGSYRKGDDIETSDLDIAVEVAGKQPIKVVQLGTLRRLDYRHNVQVHAHVFSRSTIDMNLFANIANGIVLRGFLEVRT